jgi:hypothetical protein
VEYRFASTVARENFRRRLIHTSHARKLRVKTTMEIKRISAAIEAMIPEGGSQSAFRIKETVTIMTLMVPLTADASAHLKLRRSRL